MSDRILTNRQGHPVSDNQNQRTIGDRGPATLENYQFLEKMAHFDRERVPERVVHARGATAFGHFEATGKVGDEPISTQAAYDVCEALHRAGLARRIEPAGGPARYESRVGDNHHHLVCRECGVAVDVSCVVGHAACLEPSERNGFAIDEAEVTFWGLCPRCQSTVEGIPA